MKKLILTIITAISISLSFTAYAESATGTPFIREAVGKQEQEFFEEMELLITDSFRDRVISANFEYTTAERNYVTVWVIDGDETVEQEVSNLLSEHYIITFHKTKYTLSQMEATFNEIVHNNDNVIISVDFSPGLLAVNVVVPEEYHAEYSEKLSKKYGEFISVHPFSDSPILSDGIQGRGTIGNPEKYWEENGYPGNISFAFNGGSMLENEKNYDFWIIGIVNADETEKQKIIDLLSPSCLITFEDCTYSYNERKTVYDEVLAMKDKNIVGVILGKNTEKIVVAVSEENLDRYTKLLLDKFGSVVRVTTDSEIVLQAGGDLSLSIFQTINETDNPEKNLMFVLIFTACFVFIIGLVTVIFIRSRSAFAIQTNNGDVVSANFKINEKQIIDVIEKSSHTPSDNVYKSLIERINNVQK